MGTKWLRQLLRADGGGRRCPLLLALFGCNSLRAVRRLAQEAECGRSGGERLLVGRISPPRPGRKVRAVTLSPPSRPAVPCRDGTSFVTHCAHNQSENETAILDRIHQKANRLAAVGLLGIYLTLFDPLRLCGAH